MITAMIAFMLLFFSYAIPAASVAFHWSWRPSASMDRASVGFVGNISSSLLWELPTTFLSLVHSSVVDLYHPIVSSPSSYRA